MKTAKHDPIIIIIIMNFPKMQSKTFLFKFEFFIAIVNIQRKTCYVSNMFEIKGRKVVCCSFPNLLSTVEADIVLATSGH